MSTCGTGDAHFGRAGRVPYRRTLGRHVSMACDSKGPGGNSTSRTSRRHRKVQTASVVHRGRRTCCHPRHGSRRLQCWPGIPIRGIRCTMRTNSSGWRTGNGRHRMASKALKIGSTDADGEQCDSNQRERWTLGEHPHRKANIAHGRHFRAVVREGLAKTTSSVTPQCRSISGAPELANGGRLLRS